MGCAKSQRQHDLLACLFPSRGKKFIVVLTGYIDESYSEKVFTLSCLMSTLSDWMWFERAWNKCLSATNRGLKAQGRPLISRYHASDCSTRHGEFEGWTTDEQKKLTSSLLTVFRRHFVNVISYSISVDDFIKEFPHHKEQWKEQCYGFLLKFLMVEAADQFASVLRVKRSNESVKISLIHDRGPCDGILLDAFNQMMKDPGFRGVHFFSTIAALPWQGCVPLQAADLLAYENFKDSESFLFTKRKRRYTLDALLTSSLGGRSRTIDAAGVRKLREALEPK